MAVYFTSDSSNVRDGFVASYSSTLATRLNTCPDSGTLLAGVTGQISDGPGQYQILTQCTWTIAPTGAFYIRLNFTSFATEVGADFVRVYSCAASDCSSPTLLASLSGHISPAPVTTTTPVMQVVFSSDLANVDDGFVARYSTYFSCPGTGVLTGTTGTVTDGPGPYNDNSDCTWIIAPPGAPAVTLSFSSFYTDPCCDFVTVYSCPTAACNSGLSLLGSFAGTTVPTAVVSPTGIMKVTFTSDDSVHYDGFLATYTVPPDCPGSNTNLTSSNGTLTNGPGNYQPGMVCRWMVAPPGATSITLNLASLSTVTGDFLRVYTCTSASCPTPVLVSEWQGQVASTTLALANRWVLVVFQSAPALSSVGPGFVMTYQANYGGGCYGSSAASCPGYPEPLICRPATGRNESCCARLVRSANATAHAVSIPQGTYLSSVLLWMQVGSGPADITSESRRPFPASLVSLSDLGLSVTRNSGQEESGCALTATGRDNTTARWLSFEAGPCDAPGIAAAAANTGGNGVVVWFGRTLAQAAVAASATIAVEVCTVAQSSFTSGRWVDMWIRAD